METQIEDEVFRWQVVKAMIDEYPELKEKVKTYVTAR